MSCRVPVVVSQGWKACSNVRIVERREEAQANSVVIGVGWRVGAGSGRFAPARKSIDGALLYWLRADLSSRRQTAFERQGCLSLSPDLLGLFDRRRAAARNAARSRSHVQTHSILQQRCADGHR